MMQITGKSASFRGLTLLLALMLGAGLVLTGCGDDDSSTTTPAPAPTPAPQPPAPEPPGTPANLRVASAGVDYIEFAWDAVEGATAYEVQMTMTEGDFNSARQATVTGTMHKFDDIAAATTAYGRVRAMNDDGASAWSDAEMGATMAAPPPPLGVPMPMMSDAGHDFIEWSWEAVAGAQGYQVQVADSEAGLEMATPVATTETSHRVDAEPEMEMYIRVRSAVLLPAPMASAWSDAVMGMSEVAPTPFMVSMTPPEAGADTACSGQAFCPDSQTDPKKAMAIPNRMLMVTSSHQAQVSPEYIDGASGVDLNIGDNTPFRHINWDAMQMAVATDGVTFRFQRISTAAGQEPTPMGDMMYITCGPFECSEAMDEVPAAPEISIANSQACTDFEADLTLNVGLGFNGGQEDGTVVRGSAVHGMQTELKRGIDAGWTYTSTSTASVTHEFVGVLGTGGGNLRVKGASLSKTSVPMVLNMGRNKTLNQFGGTGDDDADEAGGGPIWNQDQDCFALEAPAEDADGTVGYAYGSIGVGGTRGVVGTLQKPQECFRIVTAGRASAPETATLLNYLDGYEVHVTPNASVTWGSVNWPEGQDPFDGLDCEGVTFKAADYVDVCETFQKQATDYWGTGVGSKASHRFKFAYIVTTNSSQTVDTADPATVVGTKVLRKIEIIPKRDVGTLRAAGNGAATGTTTGVLRAPNSVWSSLWLVDTDKEASTYLSKVLGRDNTVADADLYRPDYHRSAYLRDYKTAGTDQDTHSDSFSNTGVGPFWRPVIAMELIDTDNDPIYGDFGKVDFHTSGANAKKADNFPASNADAHACSDADGTGCDATVTFDESFTLSLYQDSSECTQTIDVSFTCTWDADGDEDRTGDASGTAGTFGTANVGRFVTCTMN